MTGRRTHTARHTRAVSAPPDQVFALVADATRWPEVFAPTVAVEHLGGDGEEERLRIRAIANGEVHDWVSHRLLDPPGLRVGFRQEVASPPVESMGGAWQVGPDGNGASLVVLDHAWTAVDDTAETAAWIERAVDRNSRSELAALARTAELPGRGLDELRFSFEDRIVTDGTAQDVYTFLLRADRWPQRLPHVAAAELREEPSGIQHLRMETRSPDGSRHTTASVRVCLPTESITYKQLLLPALLRAHTGRWTLAPEPDGQLLSVTSRHTVVLDPEAVAARLGPGTTLDTAKSLVRRSMGGNSLATLGHAKAYAEARRPERIR